MRVPIKTDDRRKFHVLMSIFSFAAPFNRLSKREREVLAELYYYYNKLTGIDAKKKNKLIFDYDTRREIAKHLKVKTDQIYNITALLRRKGVIVDGVLVPKYIIKDINEITFTFEDADTQG